MKEMGDRPTSTPTIPVVEACPVGRQSWAEPLFPPARRSSLPWPLLVCGYTGGFVLVVVLALARQSGLPATGTLWAEDGVIFYSQAVAHSVLHTLVASYNGYGQLVPRLAVQLTGLGPLRDVPTTVALSGAVGLALVSCLVFHMARGLITSPALRALLVASMVLLPLAVAVATVRSRRPGGGDCGVPAGRGFRTPGRPAHALGVGEGGRFAPLA